jgi:uncharacterized protein (DUF2062 family)
MRQCCFGQEEEMHRIRVSYGVAVVLAWVMNGFALLQHFSLVPEMKGYIAATLLANMLTVPLVMWAAYVFGQIAEERLLRRRHRRAAMAS